MHVQKHFGDGDMSNAPRTCGTALCAHLPHNYYIIFWMRDDES